MRNSFWFPRAHLMLACASAFPFYLLMRISFFPAHAHFFFFRRMRISYWPTLAYLFFACACAPHLELRMRIAFWPAQGLRILTCTGVSHFDLHMRTSFTPAHAQLILSFAFAFVLPAHELFFLCSVCAYHFALPVGLAISDC